MKTERILATLPKMTKKSLMSFAELHRMDHSLVVQRAITELSDQHPREEDIPYIWGDTEQIQISLSDTAFCLLKLWSEQTGLSKSKLITYALEKTIIENGGI